MRYSIYCAGDGVRAPRKRKKRSPLQRARVINEKENERERESIYEIICRIN